MGSRIRRVRLIHWHAGEAEERAERLRAAGYEVDASVQDGPPALRALRDAPPDAVVIEGVPLARKLGIHAEAVVGLVDPPDGFTIDGLPEGAVLRDAGRGPCDLVLWFATRREDVEREIVRASRLARDGDLWVLWPKRSSDRASDLTQPIVRRAGLDRGLVDYKVVSVDETWTGLRFRPRR